MKAPLLLSQKNSKESVSVSGEIVGHLSSYHVDGIRFLYQQCFLKKQNVILNYEPGMQEEREICAFLTATKRPSPSLIVCQRQFLRKWYYEFSQANLDVLTADELIKDDSWENYDLPDAVLLTHDQLKHLKSLPIENWFFFIIQHLDNLQKSRYIKNVNANYRIGLTNQSYLDLTPELQWFVMKWANSALVEEKEKFIEASNFKNNDFLWPFPDYWRRITWETIKKFQPSLKESEGYEHTIIKWCKQNKPVLLNISEPDKQRTKRTPNRKQNKNNSATKRRRVTPTQNSKQKYVSSDSENDKNIILNKQYKSAIQYSSDSDADINNQDSYEIESIASPNLNTETTIQKDRSPSLNKERSVLDTNIITEQTDKYDCSPSLLDGSFILDSLLDIAEPSTSKQVTKINSNDETKIIIRDLKKEIKSEVEDNILLNTLIDSPEPRSTTLKVKEFRISDDENESCPILDLLF